MHKFSFNTFAEMFILNLGEFLMRRITIKLKMQIGKTADFRLFLILRFGNIFTKNLNVGIGVQIVQWLYASDTSTIRT